LWIDFSASGFSRNVRTIVRYAGGAPFFFFHQRRTAEMFLQESQRLRCLYTPQAFGSFFDRLDAFNDAVIDGFDRVFFLSCFDWSFVADNYLLALMRTGGTGLRTSRRTWRGGGPNGN
jgi:hypothetical protein